MIQLVPYPTLSVALALTWIALSGVSVAHVVFAAVLAAALPLALRAYLEGFPRLHAPVLALQLLRRLLWDIVVANVIVARLVLGPPERLRPAFIEVPLAIDHPHAIALLASIVTITPGTVSVALSVDARMLHVHALDIDDAAALVAKIKARYERPLQEIIQW